MPDSSEADGKPVYTVVAGPNGSGKSTLVDALHRDGQVLGPFINPDVIAKALPPGTPAPELAAGKEALMQSAQRIAEGKSFSRESTLTSREIMRSIETAKASGFRVEIRFVAVRDVEESIARVRQRVANGGHDIPEHVQRRRFDKSIANAGEAAKVADFMRVYENPLGRGHRPLAEVKASKLVSLAPDRPPWVDRIISGLDQAKELQALAARSAAAGREGPATPQRPQRRSVGRDEVDDLVR